MRKYNLISIFIILIFVFSVIPLFSQQQLLPYEYAVKFVCGVANGEIVARGRYLTAINIHNPSDSTVVFRKKVAVALPGEKQGEITQFSRTKIGPDGALEIDCEDIMRLVKSQEKFLKGFVVIQSPKELDVVAVYSASGVDGEITTMQVEKVTARFMGGCPDLVVTKINRPLWEHANHRSVITVTIKNIGNADAAPTLARLVDPSTPQPSGPPFNDVQPTPALAPGALSQSLFTCRIGCIILTQRLRRPQIIKINCKSVRKTITQKCLKKSDNTN